MEWSESHDVFRGVHVGLQRRRLGCRTVRSGPIMNPIAVLAAENLRLQEECQKLANLLMSPLVFTHERMVEQVDAALLPYLGRANTEQPR